MTVISIKNLVRCWNSTVGIQINTQKEGNSRVVSLRMKRRAGSSSTFIRARWISDKVARQLCSLVGAVAKVDWPQV